MIYQNGMRNFLILAGRRFEVSLSPPSPPPSSSSVVVVALRLTGFDFDGCGGVARRFEVVGLGAGAGSCTAASTVMWLMCDVWRG